MWYYCSCGSVQQVAHPPLASIEQMDCYETLGSAKVPRLGGVGTSAKPALAPALHTMTAPGVDKAAVDVEGAGAAPKKKAKPGEVHQSQRGTAGWLRAAMLGANDAIVSVSALMVGVAANGNSGWSTVLTAGLSGLIAGAMSMAIGEYVSVSSQKDLEEADMEQERQELNDNYDGECCELAAIYEKRGVDPDLALQVAKQLMAKDALQAHAIDELGIRDFSQARPLQAGIVSFFCFLVFGSVPVLAGGFIQNRWAQIGVVSTVALIMLAVSGALGAKMGGANMLRGSGRVLLGGALALLLTFGVGLLTQKIGLGECP